MSLDDFLWQHDRLKFKSEFPELIHDENCKEILEILKPRYRLIFDTSAFVNLIQLPTKYKTFRSFFDAIDCLLSAGKIIIPREVKEEIYQDKDKKLRKWLKPYLDYIVPLENQLYVDTLQEIILEFPKTAHKGLQDKSKRIFQADPHIIAAGLLSQSSHSNTIIISDESTKGGGVKIPVLAKKKGILCMNLYALLNKLGVLE